MNTDKILQEIEKLKNTESLSIEKLPEIHLYMDQITTFIEEKLSNFNRDKTQKNLTKTMINNYTKNKIIEPPEKKKYSKEHLISLIIIYHLKSILSINDIASILKNIENKEETYSYFIEKQYNKIIEIEQNVSNFLNNENENNDKVLYLILDLLIDANLKKLLAEKILDNYYNN